MSVPILAFFNNKSGVGKTSLVYHLAWMYADIGARVVAADLDPQSNLTSAFFNENKLENLWPEGDHPQTIYGFLKPLITGTGDVVNNPYLEPVEDSLALIVGDLYLSGFEDELSQQWPGCAVGKERAFRVISAFYRILQNAALNHKADLVLMDLGPNLGAINRAALISSDFVIIPLSPDLFSLQGLNNLGPTLRNWREEWEENLKKWEDSQKKRPTLVLPLPTGKMEPVGYIILQHSVRLDRPVKAYEHWIAKIPGTYRKEVLGFASFDEISSVGVDPSCLTMLKHYRSLAPLAQEARKPIFHLQSADGAIGAHLQAVEDARKDFEKLARKIAKLMGLKI